MGEAGVTVLVLNMFSFVSQLEKYSQLSDSVTVFKVMISVGEVIECKKVRVTN